MVPKLLSAGKSFKGLARYLTHDPGAETKERVAWTHTLNLAHDDVASAVDEMIWTYRAADMLKREAGIRAGGRRLENPAKHFSLNWHPSETPTREKMIETVQEFLDHMGWHEHQALMVSHNDRHPHVHVMLNAVHPETGRALDTGFEKRRAQEWAFAYEREHSQIFCEERLLPKEEREPSLTRAAWQEFKDAEKQHDKAEHARLAHAPDYFERHDRTVSDAKEWQFLKALHRDEREDFFVEGKQAFREVRNAIYREVRTEFRAEWKGYYEAMRKGGDAQRLAEVKQDILSRQNAELESRRDPACASLREDRDMEYKWILAQQQRERADLGDRQKRGLRSPDLLDDYVGYREQVADRAARDDHGSNPHVAGEFREAAEEVCAPSPERAPDEREEAEPYESRFPERMRVRDPLDAAGGIGLGALGALAGIGERLFDGFFGGAAGKPEPQRGGHALPREGRQSQSTHETERRPTARGAEAQMKLGEDQATESAQLHAYWEERARRRGRYRD